MGLHQGDVSHPRYRTMALWLPAAAVIAVAVFLALYGDSGRDWLSYQRAAIAQGEIWRLLSGHLVHLGTSHLLLNLAGLLLVWYLVGSVFSWTQWLIVGMISIVGIDLGFWFLQPQLEWYVGLSGVLHGILVAGIVGAIRTGRLEILVLAVAVTAKLVYEQIAGPLPGSEQTTGGTVIIAAHAYGAFSGAISGGLLMIRTSGRRAN